MSEEELRDIRETYLSPQCLCSYPSSHSSPNAHSQEERGSANVSEEELRDIREMYLSPVFKVTQEDIEPLLKEADIISRRINGEKLEDIEKQLVGRGKDGECGESGNVNGTVC